MSLSAPEIIPSRMLLTPSNGPQPARDQDHEALTAAHAILQQPISITLTGPAIALLSLSTALLIHFLDASLVQLLISLVPLALLIHNDYHNFLNLGPGGTPSTFPGYLKITCLRPVCLRDPFKPPSPDPNRLPQQGLLARRPLPYRPGRRPLVAGIAPQRQLDQPGSRACYLALRRIMERLGRQKPLDFGTETSCLEKHGLALFARHPLETNCRGEIFHVHDSDHSMHMCLHPQDSKEVLEKGWGQRHPLARGGRFLKTPVSRDFVMIYAPRDDQELQAVCRIISAAIWYILAEEVRMDAH